jgi:hypothetical protein
VYGTAFRAARDGTYGIESPFHCKAGTIQGFPMRIEPHRGERWVNISDHVGFVSTEPVPAELPAGSFAAFDRREYQVKAGEWFGTVGVAVYTRQAHVLTKKMADRFRLLEQGAKKGMVLQFESSSGVSTGEFEFPGKR